MKKNYISLITALTIAISAIAQQTPAPISFLGDNFIEGIIGINNSIISDGLINTDTVWFYASDSVSYSDPNSAIDQAVITSPSSSQWKWFVDMGNFPFGTIFWTIVNDGNGGYDTSDFYSPNIISNPEWLSRKGSEVLVTNIDSSSQPYTATMNIKVGLFDTIQIIDNNVKVLGGKSYGYTSNISFSNIFSFADGSSQPDTNGDLNYDLILLDQPISESFSSSSTNFTIQPTLDPQTFDLGLYAKGSICKTLLDFESPDITIPIAPLLSVGFGMGIKLIGGIGAKMIYNKGFCNYGVDSVSEFAVGAKIEASLRANINVMSKYILRAQGALTGVGSIGTAYQYWTLPSVNRNLKFGGDFYIKGDITLSGLGADAYAFFGGKTVFGPKTFWPKDEIPYTFGDGFPSSINLTDCAAIVKSGNSRTFQKQYFFDIPVQSSQPNFSTRGNDLGIVWLEADDVYQYLYFAKLDTTGNTTCFKEEVMVLKTDTSISNPKVSIFNDGNALITWTQNRFSSNNIPPNFSIENFIDAQDIKMAIYNDSTNSIVGIYPINDTLGDRAEGEAKVTTGKGDDAIISWVVEDTGKNTTDIYFVNVSKSSNGSQWSMTDPKPITITGLQDYNYGVEVSYVDDLNAVACWINDSDGNDSTTRENQVYTALWNGSVWSAPQVLYPQQSGLEYKELSVSFNEQFGGFAYTATWADTSGHNIEYAGTDLYDNYTNSLIKPGKIIPDTNQYSFSQPHIAVDESGLVSFSYQSTAIYNDTLDPDQGEIILWLNKITDSTGSTMGNWQLAINTEDFLNDTNVFVWSMDAAWGKNQTLYFLTQETDKIVDAGYDASNTPDFGISFGNASQGLVLRVADVSDNLDLSQGSLPDPSCVPTGIEKAINTIMYDFVLKQNQPNPASTFTSIEYRIEKQSHVILKIYDITGNLIMDVINQKLQAGIYNSVIDVNSLNSGMYFYTLTVDENTITKKMVIGK